MNSCLAVWPDKIRFAFTFKYDWRIAMKSFAVFAAALVLSLVVLTGTTQADLITNGTFNADLSGWSVSGRAEGWFPGLPEGEADVKYESAATAGLLTQSIGTLSVGKKYDVSYQTQSNGGVATQIFAQLAYNSGDTTWTPLAPSPSTVDIPADSGRPWVTHTFSFTTVDGQPYIDKALRFEMGAASGGDISGWTGFDNVVVNVSNVPEPSAIVLCAIGLFGLLCYAWKKRK